MSNGTRVDSRIASDERDITIASQSMFHALNAFPAFRRLWLASFAASLGQWMQSTALGWLAFDLTDSRSFVGIVTFMAGVPFLLISIPGGVLIDRFDRRRVLMICQGLAAALAVIVSTDVILGWVESWHLLVAAFCNGSLQAILNPSQQSLVPRLVPRTSLTNAVGLMSAGNNMTRVFGPSVAGAVIGFVGTGEAFLLQAMAMVAALALILTTVLPSGGAPVQGSGLRGVLDGINIVKRRDDLRGLFLLAAIPSFCVFPYISFMSVFAKDVLEIGPQGLGLLMASSGGGAVIGGLVVASGRQQHGMGRMLVAGAVSYSLVISLFALSASVWLSVPALIVAGLLGSYFMSSNNALIQHRITDDVRGRVMGTYMLTWGLMPLGALPLGIVADGIGIRGATIAGAIATILLTLIAAHRNREIVRL
ncbi:MAG: MFS transporter [Thermomicrobiales bacterium]|nr:MFS transporter [Thermomicrobiales bacterium]